MVKIIDCCGRFSIASRFQIDLCVHVAVWNSTCKYFFVMNLDSRILLWTYSATISFSSLPRHVMILTAPHLIRAVRWIPPAVAILGSSCSFLNFWAATRALTWPLPEWIYARLEEMIYSNYQAMVGFWYETWSGVEVKDICVVCAAATELNLDHIYIH